MSDGEILIGEIARCRSREDVEASVSDGEQCYKNLVAASCVSKSVYTIIIIDLSDVYKYICGHM